MAQSRLMTCLKGGEVLYRHFWMKMSDEEIARLSLPELTELIRRLLEEIEIRVMELT